VPNSVIKKHTYYIAYLRLRRKSIPSPLPHRNCPSEPATSTARILRIATSARCSSIKCEKLGIHDSRYLRVLISFIFRPRFGCSNQHFNRRGKNVSLHPKPSRSPRPFVPSFYQMFMSIEWWKRVHNRLLAEYCSRADQF
jgi:hypothetical protein